MRNKSIVTTCQFCNKPFLVRPSSIKRGRGKFCSHDCYNKAKKNRPKKRSLEDIRRYQREWARENIKKPGNREKHNEVARKYYQRHREEILRYAKRHNMEYYYLQKYSITPKQKKELIIKQHGVCAICGKLPNGRFKTLHIDHDHKTGRIRGLLCYSCNSGVGNFRDDVVLLLKAAKYLNPCGRKMGCGDSCCHSRYGGNIIMRMAWEAM